MDRETVNIAKAQTGYIDFIIKPSFETLVEVLPNLRVALENAELNKAGYEKLIPKYESMMEQMNSNSSGMNDSPKKLKSDDTDDDNN
jgi:hypothetical protein